MRTSRSRRCLWARPGGGGGNRLHQHPGGHQEKRHAPGARPALALIDAGAPGPARGGKGHHPRGRGVLVRGSPRPPSWPRRAVTGRCARMTNATWPAALPATRAMAPPPGDAGHLGGPGPPPHPPAQLSEELDRPMSQYQAGLLGKGWRRSTEAAGLPIVGPPIPRQAGEVDLNTAGGKPCFLSRKYCPKGRLEQGLWPLTRQAQADEADRPGLSEAAPQPVPDRLPGNHPGGGLVLSRHFA